MQYNASTHRQMNRHERYWQYFTTSQTHTTHHTAPKTQHIHSHTCNAQRAVNAHKHTHARTHSHLHSLSFEHSTVAMLLHLLKKCGNQMSNTKEVWLWFMWWLLLLKLLILMIVFSNAKDLLLSSILGVIKNATAFIRTEYLFWIQHTSNFEKR